MFFSNDKVAAFLNQNFECSWKMLRPSIKVDIDFGNGTKLKRTLMGNVATWFCTADGGAYDMFPGVATAEEFLKRARLAATMHTLVKDLDRKKSFVTDYHKTMKPLESADAKALEFAAFTHMDMGKGAIEDPLKAGLRRMIREHGKSRTVKHSGDDRMKDLVKDTEYNRRVRYPKVHDLLAKQPLVDPDTVASKVYKEILDVDLDDPYMGLAPYVIGGENGRTTTHK